MTRSAGRGKIHQNPEIIRMFTSTIHNISISLYLGSEQLQRRILARMQATRSNSTNAGSCRRRSSETPIPQIRLTVSGSNTLNQSSPQQISLVSLAQQPLQQAMPPQQTIIPLARRPLQPLQ